MALLYQPRPQSGLTAVPPAWSFPPQLTTTVEALTAEETWWLTKDGAESADAAGDDAGKPLTAGEKRGRKRAFAG